MQPGRTRYRVLLGLIVAMLAWSWAAPAGADDHIRGVITGRGDGGAVFVQTDSGRLLVTLSDATKIERLDGIRPVKVSSAELIPGLRVRVEGEYQTARTFIAQKVTFTKEDFRTAVAIQSGDTPTGEHEQQIATERGQIVDSQQRIAATSGALAATNARVSSLDDFTPVRSITVYFDNGKFTVSKDQKAQLQQMAKDARSLSGFMIQIAAYASAVGSEPDNQRLSMERANAVTAILQQSGVPLANVIVPAAMGISEQAAPNTTSKEQAQNRRAVVTLLQNKGIVGQ
jgi:outer membrane protein OmpA-like peptidoglycan-associated protein